MIAPKKFLTFLCLITVFLLILSFAACGETPKTTTADLQSTKEPTETTPTITTIPVETTSEGPKMYSTEPLINLLPVPKSLSVEGETQNYVIYEIRPAIFTAEESFATYLNTFIDYAAKLNGVTLAKEEGGITLVKNTALAAGEYQITCERPGIFLSASDNDGITYALATLHQILTMQNGKLIVPSYTITDKPDTSYRALMVDLARKWHTVDQVKDYIELCYLYKIKFIHLHFTDKESYTLPSDVLPKLSTKNRSYTKEEIADINKFALERNVEIIPEIDLPGHAQPFSSAYPTKFMHKAESGQSCDGNVICIGKHGVMNDLKKLFSELIDMFPNSRYIHVGGDEAKHDTCNNCKDCKAFMEANGLSSTKALYTRFVKDITDMILAMGKTPVVWEGFPKEGAETISRDIVVTAWESLYHLPNDLIAEGFTVTNSSWLPLYIVPPTHSGVAGGRWQPEDILRWNPYTWRNWWSASAAYQKPIVVKPTEQVIGGTLCAWECTYNEDITPVKENLIALSERLWNVNGSVSTTKFNESAEKLWAMADKLLEIGK
ncbi:MAG: family 20 glycosylhydrolase [Clostridia bacterium]|nr:family 20 glycosylhydrolase [Clostridia bacterium]